METGTIVLSTAGRDSGRVFCVVDASEESFALIADGKHRRLEAPKLKKHKHLKVMGESLRLAELLKAGALTNKLLRQELAHFSENANKAEG